MDMISGKLVPVIMGFLSTIIGVIFLLLTIGALDSYGRFFDHHCKLSGGDTTLVLHGYAEIGDLGPGLLVTVGDASGGCAIASISGEGLSTAVTDGTAAIAYDAGPPEILAKDATKLTGKLYTEDGDPVTITAKTAGAQTEFEEGDVLPSTAKWTPPLKITQELGGLSATLVGFMPLLVTVGFLASIWGAIGVHMMEGGNVGLKGLTTMMGAKIGMLVVLFAAVKLAPTLVDEANTTLMGLSAFSITFDYDSLQDLMFGFIPIVVTLGIVGFALYDSARLINQVRKGGGFSALKGKFGMGGGM